MTAYEYKRKHINLKSGSDRKVYQRMIDAGWEVHAVQDGTIRGTGGHYMFRRPKSGRPATLGGFIMDKLGAYDTPAQAKAKREAKAQKKSKK